MTRVLLVSNLIPSVVQPGRGAPLWNYFKHLSRIAELSGIGPRHYAPPLSRDPLNRAAWLTPRSEILDGVEVVHPRYAIVPKVARGVQGWSYRRMIARHLDARLRSGRRPDVVLALWAYPDAYATVLEARARDLPVAAMVIGSDVNALPSMGLGAEVRSAMTGADRVITVCEDLRRKTISLGASAERTDVVLNGVDLDRFRPGERQAARARLGVDPDAELVLTVGNLYPVKGPDVLVEAWRTLAARRPRARQVFVGDGPLLDGLVARVRALGLADRVRFAGRRPHEEVPDWHRAANVVVIPSRSEGIPNVLLEALACGAPVVATRVGGTAEAMPTAGAGQLVESEQPEALARAIEETLAAAPSPDAVRAVADVHSWQDAAARMLEALERTIASHRSRAPR